MHSIRKESFHKSCQEEKNERSWSMIYMFPSLVQVKSVHVYKIYKLVDVGKVNLVTYAYWYMKQGWNKPRMQI